MLAQVLIAEADSFVARWKDLKAINHKTLPARRRPPRCLRYKGTCQKGAPWFRSRRGTNWSGEENPVTD